MKKPKRYFEFELKKLNRVLRALGFVLCIIYDKGKPTKIHFASRRAYDKWCRQFLEEE